MAKRPLFFAFLILCAGIWISSAFRIPFLFENIHPPNHIKNFTPKEPVDVCITAVIVADPVCQPAVHNRIKTTFTAKALTLNRIEGLVLDKREVFVSGPFNVVSFDDRDTALEYGDYILIRGSLSRPWGLSNPGVFNYAEYLARNDIYSVITVKKGDFISLLGKDKANHILKRIFGFKHRLKALIERYLPAKEGGVLTGILLGDRSGIGEDLKDRFVKTGTVHILAISGLHVGLIASIFILLLGFLRVPRYVAYPFASFLLVMYAILTGANIPVVRATVMAVSILIGTSLNRKVDILNCLGLSGIAILLKNPSAVFDAGFQLSFATVTSIIILAPKLEEWFKLNYKAHWLGRNLVASVVVSLAAWLGIIPVIAYHFNIISPICIIANIPVVLLLSFVVGAGLTFFIAGLITPFLAEIFGLAARFLIGLLIKIVEIFSKVPFGFFWTHKWNAFEITGFYIVLGIFALALYKKIAFGDNLLRFSVVRKVFHTFLYHKKRFSWTDVFIALLAFLNFMAWEGNFIRQPDEFKVTVLDSGHGDAIVLEFPRNGCALIDAGSAKGNMDIGEDVVGPFLRSRRIDKLDAIFVTHDDEDHAGGVPAVLRNFKVRNIFDQHSMPLKRFDKISGFKGVEILVLNPPERDLFVTGSDNNNSMVLKITAQNRSFLFCADIQEDAMRELLKYPLLLKSDVIKIPHHGAGWGITEEAFLETVSPQIALISAAPKDVSDSLLNYLPAINCKAYKTYSDGAITVRESGSGLAAEAYK